MNPKEDLLIVEWELLNKPIVISHITESEFIKPHPDQIEITRSKNYDISLRMSGGQASFQDAPPEREVRLGESYTGENLSGWIKNSAPFSGKVSLEAVFQNGHSIQGNGAFEANGWCYKIIHEPMAFFEEQNPSEKQEVYKIIEYCICGPSRQVMEAVSSGENFLTETKVEWKIPQSINHDFWNYSISGKSEGHSRSGLFFKTKLGEILISLRARDIKEIEHKPASIHYSPQIKANEKGEREKILDIFSFIFGKKILSLGVKYLNNKNIPIRSESYTFFSANLNHALSDQATPSWFFDSMGYELQYDQEIADKIFNLLVDNYDKYGLKDVFIDYWMARTYTLGVDLVWYAGALEGLINKWFKVNNDKVNEGYVDKIKFKNAISSSLAIISTECKLDPSWNKIKSKIEASNSQGSRDKQNYFFQLMGLQIGEVEKDAMVARSKYAHGGNYTGQEVLQLVCLSKAYKTLFHRVLLSVIGYDGKYIDYSSYGFPSKVLSEALGGPENDGKPWLPLSS